MSVSMYVQMWVRLDVCQNICTGVSALVCMSVYVYRCECTWMSVSMYVQM